MRIYYINEFSKKLGFHPSTIRNYQKKGILPNKRNPINKYRVFTDEDLQKAEKLFNITV